SPAGAFLHTSYNTRTGERDTPDAAPRDAACRARVPRHPVGRQQGCSIVRGASSPRSATCTSLPHICPCRASESIWKASAAMPEIRLPSTTLPPLSYSSSSLLILMATPAESEIVLLRTTLLWPRSSMLLPLNSADSTLPEHSLFSNTLSCAFSLTLKHSEPNVRMMLPVTRLFELVSFSCIGWLSDFGLVPM